MFDEKEYRKQYYQKNKEKILENSKKRWREKPDAVRKNHKDLYSTKDGRLIRLWGSIKRRCKDKGLDCDLSLEYLREIAPDFCPVFGVKLKWDGWGENNQRASEDSPSVDKIDPNKGYTKDNIIIISWKANRLKSNANYEDLFIVANWLKSTTESKLNGNYHS